MSKRHTYTPFFFSSSHCQWPSVWKYRNNVFHFALPWGFTSSWVTRQSIFPSLSFYSFFPYSSLVWVKKCLAFLTNHETRNGNVCTLVWRWQVKKATEKKKSNQLNIVSIIYSLISMRVCNVMWNDFKKKKETKCWWPNEHCFK